jgi:EAL domain-containing protein (putative c-di-GMP-specific phosphodiesterase class I)
VQPNDFVPQAENTPASGALTFWVIETVAAELSGWLRANSDAHVSINVPPEIVGRGGLNYAGDKSGLIAFGSQVILELTERGVPDALAVLAIDKGDRRGVQLALDDVTLVGGANLAILARCNFDIIKLDRDLIAQIKPEAPEPEWLASVAAMLAASKLTVIAEGVETEAQLLALRAAGIQAAQGFYFSQPLPAEALFTFFRDANLAAAAATGVPAMRPPNLIGSPS